MDYLRRGIKLGVEIVEETSLGRESADRDNSFQQFAKVRKDGRAGIRFHTAQVTAGVEVSNSQLTVGKPDEERRYEEIWENDAV